MSPKTLVYCFVIALLLPLGDATLAASPKRTPVREGVDHLMQVEQPGELSGPIIFQLLLGEIALQRGQLDLAVSAYRDLAVRTRDPAVVRRAVALAGVARQYDVAADLAELWMEVDPESKEARQTMAGLLVLAGRLEGLDVLISEVLASDPEQRGENFLGLNRLLARYPDKAAVLAFVERMAQPYPTLPEAYYAVAVAAAEAGQIEQARAEARRAQAMKPDWDAPVLLEAQLMMKESGDGRVDEVIKLLSEYLSRQPDSMSVRLYLARVLIATKDYVGARKQFEAILAGRPDDPDVVYPVAMLALQEKDLETARTQFSRLLELPFNDKWTVRYFLGQVEEEAGNTATAMIHYEQVEGGPQYLAARARVAYLLIEEGKVDEALSFVRKSNVKAPDEKIQLVHMEADLLRKLGRHQEAFNVLNAALKSNPEHPGLLYDVALAAEKVGRLQDMERHLKKLIQLQPDHAHAYNALGYSLADRGVRLKEAFGLISKATQLAPEDPFIMDSMGWVLYRQDKLSEALVVLRKAYGIKPDAEIAAHLGEVLWKLGHHDEAKGVWNKAAADAPDNEALQSVIRKFVP